MLGGKRTVMLRSGGYVTIEYCGNLYHMGKAERDLLCRLAEKIELYEAYHWADHRPRDEQDEAVIVQ